jgi:hypothetical protein
MEKEDTYCVQLIRLVGLCFDRARGCGEVASSEIALAQIHCLSALQV